MNEPNPKKLITGFLILAIIVSSGAFALSGYLTTKANKSEVSTAQVLKNAFSKNKPEDLNKTPGIETGNFTNRLAINIAENIVKQNQDGPQALGGRMGIDIPANLDSIVETYVAGLEISESEFAIDEKKINIQKGFNKKDVQDYLDALQNILKSSAEGQELKNLDNKIKSSPNENLAGAANLLYSQTQEKVYSLKVPEIALELHKSVLQTLNVPIQVFGGKDIYGDPLKTRALMEIAPALINEYMADSIKEANILQIEMGGLSTKNPLGLNIVNAQFAVYDPVNWIENMLGQLAAWATQALQYESWYAKIITAQIKDRLLKQIVDAILNWVGLGDSMVGDWQTYLKNTFAAAANDYINQAAQGFCTDYRNQMLEYLQKSTGAKTPFSLSGIIGNAGLNTGCPLESIVSDINLFYNDFSAGGWNAYAALTLPSSNYYGSLFSTQEAADEAANERKLAEQSRLIAGSGFSGTAICENGSSPRYGVCNDGSTPEITTPGKQQSDLTSAGLSSNLRRIENEDSQWEALIGMVANMAINKLIASGNKGIKRGSVTGSGTSDPYAVCAGFATDSQDYLDCIDNVNQTLNPTGVEGGVRQRVISEAESALEEASNTLSLVLLSLDTVSSTIAILNDIKNSCPAEADAAQREMDIMEQDYLRLLGKADGLLSKIAAIEVLLIEVRSHEPETDTAFFTSKLTELHTYGTEASFTKERADAQAEVINFQNKLQNATNLLTQCLGG